MEKDRSQYKRVSKVEPKTESFLKLLCVKGNLYFVVCLHFFLM